LLKELDVAIFWQYVYERLLDNTDVHSKGFAAGSLHQDKPPVKPYDASQSNDRKSVSTAQLAADA
jgi:hypothetical protein